MVIEGFFGVLLVTFAAVGVASFGLLLMSVTEDKLKLQNKLVDGFWWYTVTLATFMVVGFLSLGSWMITGHIRIW
jgi:hypothetical protein